MGYLDKAGLSRAFTKLKTLIDKKSDVGHTHTKSQITDFPTSMPASDVYSWAKQPSKPSYTANEVGALGSKNANGYQGITKSDGADDDWIRTTQNGIIPYQPGTTSSLGTSGWKFREAWIQTVNGFLNGTATNANILNDRAYYQEKATANTMYYQLGSVKCTHSYQRINETYLCVSRQNACIMNLSVYSHNNNVFVDPTVSYTFLTPNAKAAFYDIFYAGLDKKDTAGNTFSIWASRGQWQESMRFIPLGVNYDQGLAISWDSWDATTEGSTTAPSFGQPASYKFIVSPHTHSKSEVGLGNVDNTADSTKSVKYAAWANGADYANYAFSNNGVSTSGNGSAYEATISGFSLATGKSIVMIPNVTSTTTTPTLNVSGTGAKNIRMRLSSSTSSTIPLINSNFLTQYKPVKVTYDGTYWVIDDFIQPDANNLYGTLISSGSSAPSSGTAGFIYIQTT